MGYFKQTIIGISWMSAFRISSRFITFIRVIILARLLTPGQFGIFGIATLVLALLEILTETGINVFLIQENKKLEFYVNDAWFVSIIRGLILSLLIILLAPFIVTFFSSPDAYRILYLISLVPLIRGFINPSIVKYQKDLLFNKEFYLRISIFAVDSFVAIILAIMTHDAISFVWGLIAGSILETIISFLFIRPLPKISFNFNIIGKIIHSGKWVTLFGIFNYFAQEGDNIVVGRVLGTSPLGIYQMGYKLSTIPISEISDVVNKVVFPVYTRIKEDKKRLKKAFFKTSLIISVAVFILSAIIFFLPKELIIFVLGSKWAQVALILKVLAIYGFLRAITGTTASLFLSVGKQNYVAMFTFIRFLTLAITIVPLTLHFGIIGAAFSALLSVLLELPLIIYFLFKVFSKNE